jgi:mannosylglycerate hydrolase
MKCVLVSHTHWDREWYRTYQAFRARLVDVVDRVLALCAADPEYRFVLDGQSIVLEDYLEIRPERRADLQRFVRGGQIAIGPWYVQPDSLLPSGEAHVRNLLEGRRVAETIGPASRMGYTPDSFGHPAQFPQLYRGFGLEAFIYWRGNGSEIDELGAEYLWQAPDGTEILACHLGRGYFAAAFLPRETDRAVAVLRELGDKLGKRASSDCVLLMNGVDHQLPDPHTRDVVEALEKSTGWRVERGFFDQFVAGVRRDLPRYRGELVGGRIANLLPGVWSTHTDLKLRNRSCEAALEGWAEPWAALGRSFGLDDERPALRLAWRELLKNQAHDSICGCSQDRVHEQMHSRYDAAQELADETTARVLERLAGLPVDRQTPWTDELELAVFNPSPHARSDVVRLELDPQPAIVPDAEDLAKTAIHPLLLATFRDPGWEADGEPVRVVASERNGRYRLVEQRPALDVELVARDVPAFGWRRVVLRRSEPVRDALDDGREISNGDVGVCAREDGTLDVRFGDARFEGLAGLEDRGDRGDTYDFDPVDSGDLVLESVEVSRARHPSGIERLEVVRTLRVPARLAEDRRQRSSETTSLRLALEARVAPGVERVDLCVRLDNSAEDHRLRLLFPTGRPAPSFFAASTFDVAERAPGAREARDWIHPPPATFPHQGWIAANGLTVSAPGLAEGEVLGDGTIAVTLLRAAGWLSRMDLETRPQPAGPSIPTPGAQCPGPLEARLSLLAGVAPRATRDAELGLRASSAGSDPLCPAGTPLLELEPRELVLSAFKPAESGSGTILRVLNPTDVEIEAQVRLGFHVARARSVRLDETPAQEQVRLDGHVLRFVVPPRALRSVELT